jgi:hypothetical protein
MTAPQKGIILILGNSVDGIAQIVRDINPQSFGFLCYTNLGLAKSTEFVKNLGIDLSCCRFEVIHNLSENREFFRKCTTIIDFLRNLCRAEIAAVCVTTENMEALALSAVLAHHIQTVLHIADQAIHLVVDSREVILVDSLSTIVKEFNLFHFKDALEDLEKISSQMKTGKGRAYVFLLTKLASAYYEWDCRRYVEAHKFLKEAKELLEITKDDFFHVYNYFEAKLTANISFVERLSGGQPALGAIDAFFNGNRRYDAGDNLICILALANSVEFCLRARLLAKNYDPDDFSKLNQSLMVNLGEKATRYFVKKKHFQVNNLSPNEAECSKATVTPGFSHKPGFIDLLEILELIDDEFLKDVVGIINAPENPAFLSVMQLNTLRNKIVHRMGTVHDEDLPKAIKLAEYLIEKFLSRLVIDYPEVFPQLRQDGSDNLISQASEFETFIRLDLRDITVGIFG